MNGLDLEVHRLRRRLDALEKQNRRLKFIGYAALISACLIGMMGLSKSRRVVEAEQFVLRDSQGRVRVVIGTPESSGAAADLRPDDPAIWITDQNGQDRAILTKDNLRFADENEKPLWSAR